jgi:hypothetical protein
LENICKESFKIINYSAQNANLDPGLRYIIKIIFVPINKVNYRMHFCLFS